MFGIVKPRLTRVRAHIHIHACVCTHTGMHAHKQTPIHTHTHTHTHTRGHARHALTCMRTHLLISVSEVSFPGMQSDGGSTVHLAASQCSQPEQSLSSHVKFIGTAPLSQLLYRPQWMAPPNPRAWMQITLPKNPVGKNEPTFTHSAFGAHWEVTKGTVCGN